MWDEEQIDTAIDETARQMTEGEPGADFRARVMERIDGRSRLSVVGFAFGSWRQPLAGLAVAALIVIVVAVLRDWQRPASRVASAPASIVRLPEPDPASNVRPKSDRDDQTGVRLKPDARYERVARGFSPAIAALNGCATTDCEGDALELPPIDLDSISVTSLAASDSIDIEPLPPAPSIAVTPLDVENEGDRR